MHLASYLRAGEAAAYELTDSPGHNAGGLALSVVHSIESAQVIVEMLLTASIQRDH
ncbi:hypothetical protein [Pseudomonas abieticivorans]|uniref:hypothetical protein n=1 Tax=Pseudomonas abieticivorans TaxID=2931382 RepID=UPI0020BE5A4C|nr:hypothetical protein [Pseudomonas sp. PIA16]